MKQTLLILLSCIFIWCLAIQTQKKTRARNISHPTPEVNVPKRYKTLQDSILAMMNPINGEPTAVTMALTDMLPFGKDLEFIKLMYSPVYGDTAMIHLYYDYKGGPFETVLLIKVDPKQTFNSHHIIEVLR